MKIKKLSQCSLEEALTAWNKGFEGYLVPIKMDMEAFINRVVHEGLSPEKSIIAFMHEEPSGIIMTGIREVSGRKIAWNGGTGIAPEYRGKGLSVAMMEEVQNIYIEEGVNIAVLESIEENERAIRLYKKMGYEVTDHLLYLYKKVGRKELKPFRTLLIKRVYPEQLKALDFYDGDAAWQCQWESVRFGEAAVFISPEGEEAGYILYKRVLDSSGRPDRIIIYQLKYSQSSTLKKGMIERVLSTLFLDSDDRLDITVLNISANNPSSKALLKMGFKNKFGQVMMKKYL
ncbi:acetyltransferase (GNAT) family protein [Cytobacillus oceanisediminis]|uniref:Acetyltransferase (GNAT) family protein n=1 Tax=Cytobacillus oceanisediminis TaxID=665099 RepID=A0A2V2ZDB5_9BACI|nr:GNAT family N-acetyltransferase [Cytobacillus oceanisediminis]PWW17524.1 acetyltransferase (GNAT) family protein [Cytobacillus oceanisediminis]